MPWFKSYLSHRIQRTVIKDTCSQPQKLSIGVPQGSVLGPLLFLIYINDMPAVLRHAQASLFADDTAIRYEASSSTDLSQTK